MVKNSLLSHQVICGRSLLPTTADTGTVMHSRPRECQGHGIWNLLGESKLPGSRSRDPLRPRAKRKPKCSQMQIDVDR